MVGTWGSAGQLEEEDEQPDAVADLEFMHPVQQTAPVCSQRQPNSVLREEMQELIGY